VRLATGVVGACALRRISKEISFPVNRRAISAGENFAVERQTTGLSHLLELQESRVIRVVIGITAMVE
jgi:hypothetical protein